MNLLDHVSIAVRSVEACRPFYDAVMGALEAPKVYDRPDALGYGERNRPGSAGHTYISVFQEAGVTAAERRHYCFRAASRQQVEAFHAAALAHGGRDNGAPGLRERYHPGYYAAFVLDPEGTRLEAVFHD